MIGITINGQTIDTTTADVSQASQQLSGAPSAKVLGGSTALGALIRALAGGGRGAAIGAVSGAAISGGAQVMSKGQQVRIPSETRLTLPSSNPSSSEL